MTLLPPSTPAPQPPPPAPPSLAQTVLQEVGLIAALLYFGGWIYLNRYYSQFDVDVALLEVDWHDVIVHSTALLKVGLGMLIKSPAVLAVIVLPILLWAAERYLPRYMTVWNKVGAINLHYYFPVIACVVGVLTFLLMAQYVGAAQARRDWVANREPIVISFKDDKCGPDAYLKEANDKWQLRLLKATPKWYFVFKPNPLQTAAKSLPIRVFHVPTSCISSVRREITPR